MSGLIVQVGVHRTIVNTVVTYIISLPTAVICPTKSKQRSRRDGTLSPRLAFQWSARIPVQAGRTFSAGAGKAAAGICGRRGRADAFGAPGEPPRIIERADAGVAPGWTDRILERRGGPALRLFSRGSDRAQQPRASENAFPGRVRRTACAT